MPGFSYDGLFDPPKPEPGRHEVRRPEPDRPPVPPDAELPPDEVDPLRGWWSADTAG